ncbi:MAG: sulfotransferase domain-containing protein [Thermoguttaceae bacterium]
MIKAILPRRVRTLLRDHDPDYQVLKQEADAYEVRIQVLQRSLHESSTSIQACEERIRCLLSPESVVENASIASRVNSERKHLWHVAAPKTGSTWLTTILTRLLGWRTNCLVNSWDRREQEVDLRPLLIDTDANLFSAQQHCRFSEPTRAFIEQFHVRVVLQGRNLFDTCVSVRDHLVKQDTISPVAYVDQSFLGLPEQRQFDFVIDLIVPWYLNFFATWFEGKRRGDVDFCWVGYETLIQNPAATLNRVLEYVGESRTDADLDAALQFASKSPTRLNVGRAGRGAEILTERQQARIRQLRDYYPHIDFSPIGL